jgi:PAS domain S-box-containing protein
MAGGEPGACLGSQDPKRAPARPLRVLLVEDSPGDARLIRELLAEAEAGFDLEWVSRLADGLERLSDGEPLDAALLDLSLPDSQGFVTFEKVRKAAPDVPIIMLTGLADEELAVQAVRCGAQDYLTKSEASGPLIARAVRYAIERQAADEALRESEEKLRLAMEASESGVWDLDVRAGTVTASAACQAMLGYEAVEVIDSLDDAWADRIHPDDRSATLRALQETIEGRIPFFEHDHRLRARSGDWIWVHGKGSIVERDAEGGALRLLMTRTNITARRIAEVAATENAKLFEEQRRIAEELQKNLMRSLPSVDGLELGTVMRAAEKAELVGGDFCDVFLLDDSHVAVLVGDVAGKGIRAAGRTETVRTAVRAFAMIDASPAFVLRKTNELLLREPTHPGDPEFATACLVVLNVRNGHTTYSSAGHPPCVHAGPFSCSPLDTVHGVPLGSLEWDYVDGHVTLALDDYLVLYTDGVTEARRGGELFDERRLIATIARLRHESPQAVAEGVMEAAASFAGELKDDLLVLALRFA